jgi:NAD(P)-dependent dehydrogenase (short-subunit alcohol dehydrogenase family)
MELEGIAGKRVIVTAAARGIGRVVAESFVQAGALVHICDVEAAAVDAFVEKHRGCGGSVADVATQSNVERLFTEALDWMQGLDVLVNMAGISGPACPVEKMDVREWRRTLDVNLTGMFLCSREAVPPIKAAGGGSIVNMSSNAGTMGLPFRSPYVASKWAIIGVTKTLAMELGPFGIRVNAICPGDVEGERIDRVIRLEAENRGISVDEVLAERVAAVSLRTMISPEDVAALILFVCSDAGAKISGQALLVDGNAERA